MPVAMRKNKDGKTLISSSDYSPLCIYLFYCTGIHRVRISFWVFIDLDVQGLMFILWIIRFNV